MERTGDAGVSGVLGIQGLDNAGGMEDLTVDEFDVAGLALEEFLGEGAVGDGPG